MGSTPLSYLYRKNQASKLRGSASPHWLVLSNITAIKSTTLFGFLIDPCSTANGIIFFLDPSSGNNSEAFQNPLFYYSEPDLNLLNKNSFYKCFFFFLDSFFSFHLAFLFSRSCPKVDVNLRLPEQLLNIKQNTSACHVCLSRKSIFTPGAIKHPRREAIAKGCKKCSNNAWKCFE